MPDPISFTVADVLDDNATFEPAALAAVRAFARSKPWKGTDAQRLEKFNRCGSALAVVYGFEPWTIVLGDVANMDRTQRLLTMKRLSVVTFLHFVAAVRGLPTFGRFRWSINIFKRCFPASYARCSHRGPYLVSDRESQVPELGE